MKKTILEIYAFAVCFFAVACFVITLGLIIWDFVELNAPEFTMNNYEFQCHQSDQAYEDCFSGDLKYVRDENPLAFPTGEQLTQHRIEHYSRAIQAETRQAVQGIAQKAIILFINLLVFLIHWRITKRGAGAGRSNQ